MITKKQLAEKMQVTPVTINNLMKQGLPFYKFGRSVRYDWDEVLKWTKEK